MGGAKNSSHFEEYYLALLFDEEENMEIPIVSAFNERLGPLIAALTLLNEAIQVPTIVVVGDQSSGKSSVLESLAGIRLPHRRGICTRVPLVIRFQGQHCFESVLYLEFNGKVVPTNEDKLSDAIIAATNEIAGNGYGISNKPLTLVVKKCGFPDLTMIDLPGITRVPVHGQPEDIYEQIRDTIMEYITPEESIILNVLSAAVDFSTCESIRLSRQVDKTGKRTLAVVTKSDKSPEELLEKVTCDDVKIGLGYVCVRNRIDDEYYKEALEVEAALFKNHRLLSKIDKSTVGIPVLADKLVQIQESMIRQRLPELLRKISGKLNSRVDDLNSMPKRSLIQLLVSLIQVLSQA